MEVIDTLLIIGPSHSITITFYSGLYSLINPPKNTEKDEVFLGLALVV